MKKVLYPILLILSLFQSKAFSKPSQNQFDYIQTIYNQIDFSNFNKLNYDAFKYAYKGYISLKKEAKIDSCKNIITICDFSVSSKETRLWIIDLYNKKVLYNILASHGKQSGNEFACDFSNKIDSHETSLGFYSTGNVYRGKNGNSLKLYGLDTGFNNNAYKRGVVLHGSKYVTDKYLAKNSNIGRSWGCIAISNKIINQIIKTIKDGTCLFIYYPKNDYLASSYWINYQTSYTIIYEIIELKK